jgi:hypothetical protein
VAIGIYDFHCLNLLTVRNHGPLLVSHCPLFISHAVRPLCVLSFSSPFFSWYFSCTIVLFVHGTLFEWLQWSRSSVLAFSTQVCRFKPGRSHWIFKGKKILSTTSFWGEVKPSIPCRRFAACKWSIMAWIETPCRQNYQTTILTYSREKILSTTSFGGEVKPSVPCRRFAACKRSLMTWIETPCRQNYQTAFLTHSSTFHS